MLPGSFIPFSPPGCPSGRLFWPCHASNDLSVQELHTVCDHGWHLCTLPDRPDVWTHHQAGDKRAQGQVEPGLPAEEMPAQCPVLYSPPLYSLPTPSRERRIEKKKKKLEQQQVLAQFSHPGSHPQHLHPMKVCVQHWQPSQQLLLSLC